jgi:hypothetical protein
MDSAHLTILRISLIAGSNQVKQGRPKVGNGGKPGPELAM